MVSADAARCAVGILGNIISFSLLISPVPTFIRICKKGSVEQYSPFPYLISLLNCILWLFYGLPFVHPHSILLATISAIGCLTEFTYLVLFAIYSDKKQRLKVIISTIVEIVAVAVFITLVLNLDHTNIGRSRIIGLGGDVSGIIMYASPLSVMKLVITTKSVEYMPFYLSLASFANAVVWTIYAILPFDPYVAAPNGLGVALGAAQLILYAVYFKSTQKQIAERKLKTELGLAQVVVDEDSIKLEKEKQIITPSRDPTIMYEA